MVVEVLHLTLHCLHRVLSGIQQLSVLTIPTTKINIQGVILSEKFQDWVRCMSYEWGGLAVCVTMWQNIQGVYNCDLSSLHPLIFFSHMLLYVLYFRSSSDEHRATNKPEVSGPVGENSVRSTGNAEAGVRWWDYVTLTCLWVVQEVQRGTRGRERRPQERKAFNKQDWGQRWARQADGAWRSSVDCSQMSWAWTRTASGRLSPKIWVCGKSAQRWCRSCWMMTRRIGACRCVRRGQFVVVFEIFLLWHL